MRVIAERALGVLSVSTALRFAGAGAVPFMACSVTVGIPERIRIATKVKLHAAAHPMLVRPAQDCGGDLRFQSSLGLVYDDAVQHRNYLRCSSTSMPGMRVTTRSVTKPYSKLRSSCLVITVYMPYVHWGRACIMNRVWSPVSCVMHTGATGGLGQLQRAILRLCVDLQVPPLSSRQGIKLYHIGIGEVAGSSLGGGRAFL